MKILIDTSVWVALFDTNEKYHEQIADLFREFLHKKFQLITIDYVLSELFTRMRYLNHRKKVENIILNLNQAIDAHELLLYENSHEWFRRSQELFLKFYDQGLSFVDASLVALMQKENIKMIFTLDKAFSKIGLKVVPIA